ncbi:MAG: tetratricopeptide repeat protein [Candidatus Marinimicrobia bacterium]|nr:tetratricopeptide repeat protein [Candidatus Neomarinimicrobiota bacterium]MCF7902655.1 tetratricopeptide repeat protein [Candidatus Neomarinimicrobiota bacterium]
MMKYFYRFITLKAAILMLLILGLALPLHANIHLNDDSLAMESAPAGVESSPVQQAFELRLAGNAELALAHLEQILAENPHDVATLFEGARTHFYLRQFAQAEEKLERAVSLAPGDERLYELGALLSIYEGLNRMHRISHWPGVIPAFRRGIDRYKRLLEINPARDDIRVLLIQSYHRLPWILGGSKRQAKAQLKLLANADPFYRTQGAVEVIPLSKMDERLALWTTLREKYPGDKRIHEALGKAYLRADNREQAVENLEGIAAVDSTEYQYLFSLALYHMELKDFDTARRYLDDYLSKIPPECVPLRAHGLMSKARIEHLSGNTEESTRLANAARELDPNVWQTSAPPPEILFRKF